MEPPDARIRSIQPGGGTCMQLELAWGRLRRWYLRTLRPKYVARMLAARRGDCPHCPHQVIDPRDLKYVRNVCGWYWPIESDPFAWRDRLPLVRVGLGEVVMLGGSLLLLAAVLGWWWWPAASAPLVLAVFVIAFFRNPRRVPPADVNCIVAPADGRVVSVDPVDDPFVGAAVSIGIFLSVFDVHINRSPADVRVVGQTYSPGKFLNALRPRSAQENERLDLRLQQTTEPMRRMRVCQIAGAIARRIVCWVPLGETLERGQAFGMIKIGSRTELVVPQETGLQLMIRPGDRVRAGVTVIARYEPAAATAREFQAELEKV